jgi:hypothetical protein
VIPVEVTQTRWHFMTWPDAFDHWQTIIGGVFALVAASNREAKIVFIARNVGQPRLAMFFPAPNGWR